MKKYIFKIQSISDIITNSSTEVFMVYDESAFKRIKEIVNAILESTGFEQRFDDLFEIKVTDEDNYDGYEVVAKDVKNAKLAKVLSGFDKVFETYAEYC